MKLKIVLVEDNRMERKNIEYIVNSISVCELAATFPDGQKALEYLRENEADILIADIQMPVLNGVELIRKVVDENINVEKIVISAYSNFDYAKQLLDCDVIGYVMKPFVDKELEDAIMKAIEVKSKKKEKEYKMNMYMARFEKMSPVLIDNFFRNLILMPQNNPENIERDEKILNLTLKGKYKTVMSVSVSENKTKIDIYMHSLLTNVISDSSTEKIKCYPLMLNENEITVVAVHEQESNILVFAIELKNTIIEKYGIDVFIGVSTTELDSSKLNILYNQSRSIIKNYSKNYKNVVISYSVLDECENEHELSMDALQYEIKNVIIGGNNENCKKLLEKYIDSEKSKIWLHNFAFCYVNILETILNEAGDSFNNLIGSEKVWKALASFDSIANLEQWLYNLTMGVIFQLKNSKVNEKMIANKVIKVIEECYNQKINVKYIADKLNFSREYLHRVFVRVTGQSVLEYLTDYRINKAKEFLAEGKDVVNVMEMVGYSDKSHFIRVFKLRTGVTPMEYKRS